MVQSEIIRAIAPLYPNFEVGDLFCSYGVYRFIFEKIDSDYNIIEDSTIDLFNLKISEVRDQFFEHVEYINFADTQIYANIKPRLLRTINELMKSRALINREILSLLSVLTPEDIIQNRLQKIVFSLLPLENLKRVLSKKKYENLFHNYDLNVKFKYEQIKEDDEDNTQATIDYLLAAIQPTTGPTSNGAK